MINAGTFLCGYTWVPWVLGGGCDLGSRGRTVSETYQSPCEAVHWEFPKRAKDGGGGGGQHPDQAWEAGLWSQEQLSPG